MSKKVLWEGKHAKASVWRIEPNWVAFCADYQKDYKFFRGYRRPRFWQCSIPKAGMKATLLAMRKEEEIQVSTMLVEENVEAIAALVEVQQIVGAL